jgi:hypothetical protein
MKKCFLIFSTFLFFFLFGCSQSVPVLHYAKCSLVFEYDDESNSKSRLSVFVKAGDNVKRVEKLIIKNQNHNLCWTVEDLVLMQSSDRLYCGYPNLVVQTDDKIPTGHYDITFVQADGNEKNISVNVTYDDIFYNSKSEEIPNIVMKKNGSNKIAVYDESNVLLYFGEKSTSYESKEKILKNHDSAFYYNDLWFLPNNSVICIMAPVYLQENENSETSEDLEQNDVNNDSKNSDN